MVLNLVHDFLASLPAYNESSDGVNCTIRCPFCGDSTKSQDHGHFSIKLNVDPKEPMWYQCFRASCGAKGILNTHVLQMLGCTDMNVLRQLSAYNNGIDKNFDKPFIVRKNKGYELVNLETPINDTKLKYLNGRLGTEFEASELRNFKVQLGLYEFLRINSIQKLAFPKEFCDKIEANCIGFMSMYSDYLIFRDCSKNLVTGRRYHMYRAAGKPTPGDTKLYTIPTEIDILDPDPADINIAEGTFSILGAYLHTNIGRDHKNSIWCANCGTGYLNTIMHLAKQYGLLDMSIHIWSDSEIPVSKYEKLLSDIDKHIGVMDFKIHYNSKAEDFGHPKKMIKVDTVTLK